jgi:quinoprotein dehydrogenase-associated probable ABC transporter substrate-binding protein
MDRRGRPMKSVLAGGLLLLLAGAVSARELRVCADPNNLPYSNKEGQGFENRIVEILARQLGAEVKYTWWAQRRGAIRNTLAAEACDVVPGMASGMEGLATTRPYYRSSYVFVSRADGPYADLQSLDDPRLRDISVGIQLVGDDGANTPPAEALVHRGIIDRVKGFMVYGNYESAAPQSSIIDAVADGTVDIAIVWGPPAGFFASRSARLQVRNVQPWLDGPGRPMVFDISMAMRKSDRSLRRELDRALEENAQVIAGILAEYHVPAVCGDSVDSSENPAATCTAMDPRQDPR